MIGTELLILDDTLTAQRLVDDYEQIEEVLRWAGNSSLKLTMSRFAEGADLLGVAIDNDVVLYLMFRDDSDMLVYLVEQVERELDDDGNVTDNIIVSGREASLLEERLALPSYTGLWTIDGEYLIWDSMYDSFSGPAQSAMLYYVNENAGPGVNAFRRIEHLAMGADQGLGEAVEVNARFDNLLELLQDIHELSPDIGWRTVYDADLPGIRFEAVQGNDLTGSVVFSHQFDNLQNSKYLNTNLGRKTYGVVAGQGEGVDRTTAQVFIGADDPTGVRRREVFIDARDIKEEEVGSAALFERGKSKLRAMQPMASFEADIYVYGNYAYGEDWSLGDLVTLKNNQWEVQRPVRIVTVTKVRSPSGIEIKAELDHPWPSLKDKIKSSGGSSGGGGNVKPDYPQVEHDHVSDGDWVEVTNADLEADWEVYGGAWRTPGYRIDTNGTVHLRGLIRRTAGSGSATIFTLPSAYRPAGNEIFDVRIATPGGAMGRVDVMYNGPVQLNVGGNGGDDVTSSGWVSLAGITFDAG